MREPKSHKPKKMSTLNPAYAGVRKIKGGRRTSPSRDGVSHPTQTAAIEHAENGNGPAVDDKPQGTELDSATSVAQHALQLMVDEEATSRTHQLDADAQYVAELEASLVADAIAESERQDEEDAALEAYMMESDIESEICKTPTSSKASDDNEEEYEPPEASVSEPEYPPQDDVDTDYHDLIEASYTKWMRATEQRTAKPSRRPKVVSDEDHESKGPIASSGTLRKYAKALNHPSSRMERMMEADKISRVDRQARLRMFYPEPASVGYEIAAKFQIDVSGPSNLSQTLQK